MNKPNAPRAADTPPPACSDIRDAAMVISDMLSSIAPNGQYVVQLPYSWVMRAVIWLREQRTYDRNISITALAAQWVDARYGRPDLVDEFNRRFAICPNNRSSVPPPVAGGGTLPPMVGTLNVRKSKDWKENEMTTGTGLMLLGMWMWAAVCCGAKHVTNAWGLISIAIALLTTLIAAMAS